MDNSQGNVRNEPPRFDWRSFRFTEEFVSDPRETYFIEFGYGPTRMLVPYQLVMDVVDKMETSIEESGGVIPYVKDVEAAQKAAEAEQTNDAESGN